jgi:putative membrane-bound dehydrogenase-like protein
MRKLAPFALLLAVLGLWLGTRSPAQQPGPRGWAGAAWVWDQPDAHQTPQSNDPRYLRRTFALPAKVSKAELWITADNHYVVYLNGKKVGSDGEWNTVEKYDVAKFLTPGKNVLAIQATNQGGPAGVIARLHVRTADRKDLYVITDQHTKITQKAPKGWETVRFDDSAWFDAIVLGEAGMAPWNLPGGAAMASGGTKGYGSSAVDPKIKNRLTAQEQLKHFLVPKDFEIELVAADPVVINPITMVLDDRGRIIVSESHTYRYGPPGSPIKPFANPVIRLDPDGKGGFTRTLVADGFDDPVMGIALKDGKLWLTANNYLYQYDLLETAPKQGKKGEGVAVNRKTLLVDRNKAWNPFGMFVLEWGPDGKLYMSVGNHSINIEGPDGKISARGSSGMIMRMNPDGTKMERLVHGLRVPYSFEYDPFGQLWLLSNGEGNPDRFVRVIEGVDYHCYSRGNVDNNWLAGNHPLAPPCEEVHGGAHTQFLRYFAAAYPKEYQGNLFACNWGRHGFAGANRGIFRFVLDERNNIVKKETLVACTDPHFRPSHIHLDPDGNLLIADWYGRDDESDMTGRIWRLKYVGKGRPVVKHQLDSPQWKNDDDVIDALGSPHHVIRAKAMEALVKKRDAAVVKKLGQAALTADPLGAANALWVLFRINNPSSQHLLATLRLEHGDWRVRRLTANICRRCDFSAVGRAPLFRELAPRNREKDPAVQVMAALDHPQSAASIPIALTKALVNGAARDVHLRYEAAWHLARHADEEAITTLLRSDDADVRLAGLIAIDVACYENFPSKKAALAALGKALENPGKLDPHLLLTVAKLDGDASTVPALEKLIAREDLPPATTAQAILVLKAKAGGLSKKLSAAAGKRLIAAVEKGALRVASTADQLILFEFLEAEGPTPFALKQIAGQFRSNNAALREAAHVLARKFGPKSAALADSLWPVVLAPKVRIEEAVDSLATLARVEGTPRKDAWEKLLGHDDPLLRAEAVRWWRQFKDRPELADVLVRRAPELIRTDPALREDLAAVLRDLGKEDASLKLPAAEKDRAELTQQTLAALAALPKAERPRRALLGRQVFERTGCTRCHTTATQTTALAPSLKGIAGQKVDYLIESVLYPSKVIKTGFESETVVLKDGRTLAGLVKDEGKILRVLNLDRDDRVAKTDVERRSLSRVSIMPEGQEAQMSRREFADLIAYLMTLR